MRYFQPFLRQSTPPPNFSGTLNVVKINFGIFFGAGVSFYAALVKKVPKNRRISITPLVSFFFLKKKTFLELAL